MLIPLPVLPVVPCLEHDQENVLLNVFPSMVIGIVKLQLLMIFYLIKLLSNQEGKVAMARVAAGFLRLLIE